MIVNISVNKNSTEIIFFKFPYFEKSCSNFSVHKFYFEDIENIKIYLKKLVKIDKDISAEDFYREIRRFCRTKPVLYGYRKIIDELIFAMNSAGEITRNNIRPISILCLKNKPLPKITNICQIDNNIYFLYKNKYDYNMYSVDTKNLECVIPFENIIKLYKKLRTRTKRNRNRFIKIVNLSSNGHISDSHVTHNTTNNIDFCDFSSFLETTTSTGTASQGSF